MKVEVVYALAASQAIVELKLPEGVTAQAAVEASGLVEKNRSLSLNLGLFGKRIPPDHVLKEGDRVEILRPLPVDPKEARRSRALKQEARRSRARAGKARRR